MDDESENDLRGMTINERLVVASLMEDYEQAARDRDSERMIALLVRTHLPRKAAEETTKAVLAHPEFYGF